MKALVYTGTQELVYRDEKDPLKVNGESILKVYASGICGSDMHAYHGHDERRVPPLILGHEVSGEVQNGKFKGKEGPVKNHNISPVYFDVEIEKGKKFNFELSPTHNSLIYLIEGEIKVGEENHKQAKNSKLIILTKGRKLEVSGLTKAKFLLISGKPIGEIIARGGPFVMNTKEEILKAVEDYHNGNFVKK